MNIAARIRARWLALPRRGKWVAAAVVAIGLLVMGAVGTGVWLVAAYVTAMERAAAAEYSEPFTIGGQRVVVSRVNQPNRAFFVEVRDAASGELLVRSSASASPFMRWSITQDSGVIWFHSSDIGTFLYVPSVEGTWKELAWGAPEVARQYRRPESLGPP